MPGRFVGRIEVLSLLFGACLVFGSAQPAEAAKFIEVRIEKDGKLLFSATFTAADTDTAADIWDQLRKTPFARKWDIGADKKDQVLKEKITLTVIWPQDTALASAKLDELRIVYDGKKDQWSLPPEEVERTAKAAGLKLPKSK